MSLTNIFLTLAIIAIILTFIIACIELNGYDDTNYTIIGVVVAAILFIASGISSHNDDNLLKETAKISMEKGYEVYIDGIKTDHIDFTQYDKIKIDTKNQIIYVSVSASN